MSYAHCKLCFRTIYASDLENVGTVVKDCGVCGLETSSVDIDTDADVGGYVPVLDIPSDEEIWVEYSSQSSSKDKITGYFHSRILGTEEYHHGLQQCLASETSEFHSCMSQSDRKRDSMFNTEDDDI